MKTIIRALILLLVSTSCVLAQRFQARFVTSGYAWERHDTVGRTSPHFFGFQSVQLSLAGEDLSFHTYIQGFNDFAGPLKNDPVVRLYNLYLRARNIAGIGEVSVGRQAVFAGVGNGTIDGGTASLRLLDSRLRLLGYYGLLPPPRHRFELIGDRENNRMYGAQLVALPVDFAQLSVSYTSRHIKPEAYTAIRRDSLFNPFPVEINPTATAEQYLGADVNVEHNGIVSVYGRYDYDVNFEKMARVQIYARLKPFELIEVPALRPLGVTGELLRREPRLSFNSIFSVFAFNTLEEYEAGLEYAITPVWQVFTKYGTVSYGDEESQRLTIGVHGNRISLSLTSNTGYAGKLAAASANLGYPIIENKLIPTLMASYAEYKLSEQTETQNALSVALGIVFRPLPLLSLDAQGQWITNKIYKNDLRLQLRASYFYSHQLRIF